MASFSLIEAKGSHAYTSYIQLIYLLFCKITINNLL